MATAVVTPSKTPKIIAWILLVIGVIMIVASLVVALFIRGELVKQNIVVSEDTPTFNSLTAGKVADGPLDAYAEAAAINMHSQNAAKKAIKALDLPSNPPSNWDKVGNGAPWKKFTGDEEYLSYADLGAAVNQAKAVYPASGKKMMSDKAASAQAARDLVQTGQLLRASLFTSIMAYGVCLLVFGVGVITVLTGIGLRSRGPRPAAVVVEEKVIS